MSSAWRTLITVAVLYATSRAYAVVVTPLTRPVVAIPVPGETVRTDSHLPVNAERIAEAYLPEVAWAPEATMIFKIGDESYTFSKKYLRIEDDRQNRVRFSPFALVWFDPSRTDHVPYTMTCLSAVVEFENAFRLEDSSRNRVIGGRLEGDVQITGPDGLEMTGKNFTLSEEDALLYSNHPVSFAYGPAEGQSEEVRGSADQLDITLITGDDSLLGTDLPRIGGIERIRLRSNVKIELVIDDQQQPLPTLIQCDGQFTYDVVNLVATLDENVEISRPTHATGTAEQFDRLHCDRLELLFEERPAKGGGGGVVSADGKDSKRAIQTVGGTSSSRSRVRGGFHLDLQLRALRAHGEEVLLTSDENELTCWMQELRYDVPRRTLGMLHHQDQVKVQHRLDVLACADIEMTHDLDQQIQTATCLGVGQAGRLKRAIDEGEFEFEVESSWTEQLILRPDTESGLTLLEMSGDARVIQRSQQSGVVGDKLSVWLESAALQQSRRSERRAGRLPLRRVVAEQTGDDPVAMISPTLHLDTKRLVVDFEEQTAEAINGTENEQGEGLGEGLARRRDANTEEPPVIVTAGEVRVRMTFDPATEKLDFTRIDAITGVQVKRNGNAQAPSDESTSEGPFSIDCEQLIALNPPTGHVLRLQGQPARIRLPRDDSIEGNDILFDRGNNMAEVNGPGELTLLVDHDLDGEQLDKSSPLSVKWRESMTFDGQEATFLGETETILSDSVLMCEELHVHLNQRIDFSNDHPPTDGIDLESVHGWHNVTAEFHEWAGRTLIGIRKMEVAEFEFNRSRGTFGAKGPGTIYDWQKGNGRSPVAIGPSAVSRANDTVNDSKLPWNYTQLKFAGNMTGNQLDRSVELKDRVEVTHAPVEHALDIFQRGEMNDLTESAKNAVWLGSDRMNFRLIPADSPNADDTLEVIAFGNAEVEGQTFGASGHSISYDQSKERFTLKGGRNEAHIWQQDSLGSTARRHRAKTIQYVPSKQLIIEGGRSTNFSQ